MTPTTLAAALLKDVPRYTFDTNGELLYEREVLATLTAAMDPAIAEKAGEEIESLRLWNRDDAADLITAILAQNAALRAERDRYLRHLTAGAESLNAYKARAEAAEAKVEKLRGALMVARAHVANNAEGWSVSRGAARDDLTIVDAALATEADNG